MSTVVGLAGRKGVTLKASTEYPSLVLSEAQITIAVAHVSAIVEQGDGKHYIETITGQCYYTSDPWVEVLRALVEGGDHQHTVTLP